MKKLLFLVCLMFSPPILADEIDPLLIGGKPVEKGEYPEVVYISMGNGRCSATVIGPRVILTAAHCARGGKKVTFQHNQTQYSATCNAPSVYPKDDHDISLCLTDKKVEGPYASLSKSGPRTGDKVTLIGYGCTRPGGGGGNDGVLRVGVSTVTGFTTWDFVTKKNAALCYGDSGGPAFNYVENPKEEHHYILGVNSKGDIRTTSYLSKMYSSASKDFVSAWATAKEVEICGHNLVCDEPPPPKLCEAEYYALDNEHKVLDKNLDNLKVCMFTPTVSLCKQEIDALKDQHPSLADAFNNLDKCLAEQ